jgi:hypothetical protein
VADFDRIAFRRRHSELGEVDLRRAIAAIIGARSDANRRENQAHENAPLSH